MKKARTGGLKASKSVKAGERKEGRGWGGGGKGRGSGVSNQIEETVMRVE